MSDAPSSYPAPIILAIDPGRAKCGLAVVDAAGIILLHRICPRRDMQQVLPGLVTEYAISQMVLGGATTSRALHTELRAWLPQVPVATVDETGSTLAARGLYWQLYPPQGWRRFVPLSLQMPPEPLDDLAAVILARRFMQAGK